MKMIKYAAGMVGLMMSASIMAVDAYTDTTAMMTGDVASTDCPALSSTAKVKLSTGVNAALHCRSVHSDAIVATCHSSGNVNPEEVTCICNNVSATAEPDHQMNISTCPGSCGADGTYVPTVEGVEDKVLVAGRKAFAGNTSGGSVSSYSLGDTGLCDSANLPGITVFP